ncbi:MAG: DNA polymerase III subunit delta [Bacteroidales bacterium]|nr:DNA polymerase III subunit delta [Bacteroidales bacterium]
MFFREIAGQKALKERLIKSVRDQRVSHAQLFLGKQGVGGLPLALAYAQYISCTNRQESDSCGECPSCKKFSKLIHPDLHFVFPVINTPAIEKAVSDNYLPIWRERLLENPYISYDEWLESLEAENKQAIISKYESESILHKLSFKTYESEYKVMIIWLPEKMNQPAANKLLKILEEPWEKTVFLLVSEDTQHMLTTILSRTQLISVGPIEDDELIKELVSNQGVDEKTAAEIALLAEGSLSRAMHGLNHSEENRAHFDRFTRWMRNCYTKNIPEMSTWVDEMAGLGREKQKAFLIFALRLVRESFLLNNKQPGLSRLAQEEAAFCSKFAPFIHQNNTLQLADELNTAHYHIERNGYAKLVFFDLSLKIMQLLKA